MNQTKQVNTDIIAGRIQHYLHVWKAITNDKNILDMVKGCHITFKDNEFPEQSKMPHCIRMNERESDIVSQEINKLCLKGVLEVAEPSSGQFVSSIFLRPKPDGSFRMILNLKNLNKFVEYNKFKMDTLHSILKLVTPGCYMATIDLRDAYYMVPIVKEHRKFLRFYWDGILYQYTCFPNGLSSAPRLFTKLMKPCYANLRLAGHTLSGYIDDTFIKGQTYEAANETITQCKGLMESLGFLAHPDKSMNHSSQRVKVLGFEIDSVTMTVSLTLDKKEKLRELCIKLMGLSQESIRNVAKVIGKMVSSFPGVEYGRLYYRNLEIAKIKALKNNQGNFDAIMKVTPEMKSDLEWWVNKIGSAFGLISRQNPELVIQTDASLQGWGAICENDSAQGKFLPSEINYFESNINALELLAIKYALECFQTQCSNKHVLVQSDNTTAVAYINSMGGTHSVLCNNIAKIIWEKCIAHNIWVTATHIPGKANIEADFHSRNFNDRTEWELDSQIFHSIVQKLGTPCIDTFASYQNKKLPTYFSWKSDPTASHVDAFTINWNGPLIYCFPPFSLLGRCLQKICMDQAEAIVVMPKWPTQTFYSKAMEMLVTQPLLLPTTDNILLLPTKPDKQHPLLPKLQLMACRLSGDRLKSMQYLESLPKSYLHLGAKGHTNNTAHLSIDGSSTVVCNRLIVFGHL